VFFLRSAIWVDLRISWSCSEQRLALYYVRHVAGANVVLWGREFLVFSGLNREFTPIC
jgi:hypothetical protein